MMEISKNLQRGSQQTVSFCLRNRARAYINTFFNPLKI